MNLCVASFHYSRVRVFLASSIASSKFLEICANEDLVYDVMRSCSASVCTYIIADSVCDKS